MYGATPSWAQGGFKGRAQRMMKLPQVVMFPQPQGPLLPALSESRERITPCNLAGSWSHKHTHVHTRTQMAECDPPVHAWYESDNTCHFSPAHAQAH